MEGKINKRKNKSFCGQQDIGLQEIQSGMEEEPSR